MCLHRIYIFFLLFVGRYDSKTFTLTQLRIFEFIFLHKRKRNESQTFITTNWKKSFVFQDIVSSVDCVVSVINERNIITEHSGTKLTENNPCTQKKQILIQYHSVHDEISHRLVWNRPENPKKRVIVLHVLKTRVLIQACNCLPGPYLDKNTFREAQYSCPHVSNCGPQGVRLVS